MFEPASSMFEPASSIFSLPWYTATKPAFIETNSHSSNAKFAFIKTNSQSSKTSRIHHCTYGYSHSWQSIRNHQIFAFIRNSYSSRSIRIHEIFAFIIVCFIRPHQKFAFIRNVHSSGSYSLTSSTTRKYIACMQINYQFAVIAPPAWLTDGSHADLFQLQLETCSSSSFMIPINDM